MSKKSVFCTATSYSQAELIVDCLRDNDFPKRNISVLLAGRNASVPEGIIAGTDAGGIFDGAVGWLAGIGALIIPGAGPFIVVGPIMAALSSASVKGLAGSLVALGIPAPEASRYEGKLKEGNMLLCVDSDDPEDVSHAERIFKGLGGQDICTTDEPAPSTPRYERQSELHAHH